MKAKKLFPDLSMKRLWDKMNEVEELVEELDSNVDEQNKNLGGLRFGVDGDGNYGYYGADDSLIPFKKGGQYIVQSGQTGATSITNCYQGRTQTGSITFPEPFPSAPSCMIRCTNSNHMCVINCTATTTKINWEIYNTNSASAVNTYISWVAWLEA